MTAQLHPSGPHSAGLAGRLTGRRAGVRDANAGGQRDSRNALIAKERRNNAGASAPSFPSGAELPMLRVVTAGAIAATCFIGALLGTTGGV